MTHAHSHAQGTIYNAIAAARARDLGMELAAGKNNVVLEFAKEGARRIALSRDSREVSADDVQQWLVDQGLEESVLGNAAGSVFKASSKSKVQGSKALWKCVGWTTSKRELAHGRGIRVWKWVGPEPFATNYTNDTNAIADSVR
jgi:hypothetical protein